MLGGKNITRSAGVGVEDFLLRDLSLFTLPSPSESSRAAMSHWFSVFYISFVCSDGARRGGHVSSLPLTFALGAH